MVENIIYYKNEIDISNYRIVEKNINKLLGTFIEDYDSGVFKMNYFKNNFKKFFNEDKFLKNILSYCYSYLTILYETLKSGGFRRMFLNDIRLDKFIINNLNFVLTNKYYGFKIKNAKAKKQIMLIDVGGLQVDIGGSKYVFPPTNIIHNFIKRYNNTILKILEE